MLLVFFHVLAALGSIIFTGFSAIKPSAQKQKISICLVASTLISGSYLVYSTHSNMLSSCETGLVYFAVVSALSISAHKKLQKQKI
jgi:hypothetical protein